MALDHAFDGHAGTFETMTNFTMHTYTWVVHLLLACKLIRHTNQRQLCEDGVSRYCDSSRKVLPWPWHYRLSRWLDWKIDVQRLAIVCVIYLLGDVL